MKLLSNSPKFRVVIIASVLFSSSILIDYIFFQRLYFLFPNEMEWDTSPWYNFGKLRETSKNDVIGHKVLVAGSSVALYSILPDKLSEQMAPKFHTQFYSHVAMAPTDLYYYKEDIAKAKPELVVYLLNFADLQWEYNDIKNGKLIFNERRWIDEFSDRYPAKIFYPNEFLFDYFGKLTRKQISKLAAKSLYYVSRYRVFFFDPLETFFDNHFRTGRGYHKYSGSLPLEGIWSRGWTRPTSTLLCDFTREADDSVYILKENTKVQFTLIKDEKAIYSKIINFPNKGWQKVQWSELNPSKLNLTLVRLEVISGLSTAKEVDIFRYGKDFPVGIRLSHYFCKLPTHSDKSYIRENYLDEKRFSEMSSKEYDEDYFQRILDGAGQRPELGRLNTLRNKKREVSQLTFHPWFEVNQILRISEYFKEKQIPFVLIMSPENPIESNLYVDGIWYKELLIHLAVELKTNGHQIMNHTKKVNRKQYFFDPHHLTYDGAIFYQPLLEGIIRNQFNEEKR